MSWYVDRGLEMLIAQWRRKHPRATVGTIADKNHEPPSDHLPEEDGSVDAGDFMPGSGVTEDDLDELAETLRRNRDRRIAYVIRRDEIFSSTVQPWQWRPYRGPYHKHTHVSVNDRHENDASAWMGIGESKMSDEVLTIVKRIDRRGPDWHLQNEGTEPRSNGQKYGFLQIQQELLTLRADAAFLADLIRGGQAQLRADVASLADLIRGGQAQPIDYDKLAQALLRQIAGGQG